MVIRFCFKELLYSELFIFKEDREFTSQAGHTYIDEYIFTNTSDVLILVKISVLIFVDQSCVCSNKQHEMVTLFLPILFY